MKIRLIAIVSMLLILSILTSPAWAGCGKWVIRETTDYLEDPIFDAAVDESTGSSATVNPDGTAKEEKNEMAEENKKDAASNTSVAVEEEPPAIDLAGKWTVRLETIPAQENAGRIIDLILIQTGDRLQGYGTVVENGSSIPATSTGFISEESISLNVKLTQQKDYMLHMALIKSVLEGSYELYEMEKLAEKGNATASRSNS